MKARMKLTVQEVTEMLHGGGAKRIVLRAEYDESIPEDRRFHQYTPSATLEALVSNPLVVEMLTNGRQFYLDLVPVEEAPGPAAT